MIGNPRSVRTAFLAKLVIWCVLLWSMPATAGTWKLVGTGDAPKLNEALTQVRSLESEIAQALANATPVKLAAFPGPSSVALGEWATFYIEYAGGIPLCCGVPDGPCGDTVVTTYWYPVDEHRSCWCRSETQYSPRE